MAQKNRGCLLFIIGSTLSALCLGVCLLGFALIGSLPDADETPTPSQVVQPITPTPRPLASPTATRRVTTPTTPSADATSALQNALRATVLVVVPDDSGKAVSSGTGSVLTAQGHVLTNFHVIGDIQAGRYLNRQGLVYIGVNPPDFKTKPRLAYMAQIIQADPALDLALVRVIRTVEGNALPVNLGLSPIAVGDSEQVQIGEEVTVLGFPGLGDETVTLTRGIISGFLDDSSSKSAWFKTDTELNPGNSGGPAINKQGQMIGVATSVRYGIKVAGKLGWIRPAKFARTLVQTAQSDSQSPAPTTAARPATVAPTAIAKDRCPPLALNPKPSGFIAQVTMAENVKGDNYDPVNPTSEFKTTAVIHAVITIQNARANTNFKAVWFATNADGVPCNFEIDDAEIATSGSRNIDFFLRPSSQWPPGAYRVEIWVNNTLERVTNYTVR